MLSNGTCSPCPAFCQTCTSSTVCSECLPGYFYDSSPKSCQACSLPNVLSCSTSTLITKCKPAFYLSSNSCFACRPNCLSCVDSLSCVECALGFVIRSNAGQYCQICPDLCTSCQAANSNICLSCLTGYAINVGQTCSQITSCVTNCALCLSGVNCYRCADGYFLTSAQACVQSALKLSALCLTNAYGNRYYHCLACQAYAYSPPAAQNSRLCLPIYASPDGISRYVFLDAETNRNSFSTAVLAETCGTFVVNYAGANAQGQVVVSFTLESYYQLAIRAKVFIKQDITSATTFTIRVSDSSASESITASVTSAPGCSEVIVTGSTRTLSKSSVTLTFSASKTVQFGVS